MFRYSDGQYNSMPSGRPVSSLSSGSSDGVSAPSSPIFQLNFSSSQLPSDWNQRKKDRDSSSRGVMGADFPFPPQLIQQAFQESFSNARQNSGKKSPKPDSYKTVMCQAWLESKVCSFAENCRFAHGETELRPSKVMPKQNSKYKTKLCDKYTTTGLCPYGTRCLFIHPGVSSTNGNNAYIRPDKLVEVSQRHALAEITPQKPSPPPVRSVSPDMEPVFGSSPTRPQLRPHPSWPLEPANFFSDKTEDQVDFVGLFGCFEASTTPNRVSLTSGYGSGGSSPFSTVSSSSVNLTTSDEEHFERDYFRTMGLENLAEELTRNLTTTELW